MKASLVLRLVGTAIGLITVAVGALLLTPRGAHVNNSPIGPIYW
jgi:hypothetical protein